MSNIIFHGLIGLLVMFICLPLHECAHGWVAGKMGDDTARQAGRVTLNPFAHLDVVGSICMLISAVSGIGFGWAKPVPVNPNNFKNKKLGMGLTALAGPLSNFLLAFVLMIIAKIVLFTFEESEVAFYIFTILCYMVLLNVGLTVFNFIPIPPLDGSKILASLLPNKIYYKIYFSEKFQKAAPAIQIMFILLILSNLLDPILIFLQGTVFDLLDFLTRFVDIIFSKL